MSESAKYRTRPYPDELVRSIWLLPAAQKRKMEEAFIGKKVAWQVAIHYIRPQRGAARQLARLALLDRGHEPWIYCDIDLADYPQLALAQQGRQLAVEGEIADVNGKEITLKDAVLRL